MQQICHDKVNQLRHVRYLKNKAHTLEIMKGHAAILEPKFRTVADYRNREIAPLGFAQWNDPPGRLLRKPEYHARNSEAGSGAV